MSSFVKYGFDQIPKGILDCFPGDVYNYKRATLNASLKDLSDEKILKQAVKQILKNRDWTEDQDTKRWYKLVVPRARALEGETANTLLSLFSEAYCHRGDKIQTHIEEDVLMPECQNSPINVDFPEVLPKLVSERECVFSVEHKRRDQDPFIRCDDCNGSGMVKCEHCNGTGREQYVEGNFASGEEKIRTGNCPECGGRGRVQCPKCMGEGKIPVYAPEYSIVRSVHETVYFDVSAAYGTPWRKTISCFSHYYDPNPEEGDMYGWILKKSAEAACQETKGKTVVKYKNRHTRELDLSSEVQEELKKNGMEEIYKSNLRETKMDTDNPMILREESHIILPARRIKARIGDAEFSFFVFENGPGSLLIAFSSRGESYLSFPKYIVLGFYYFLVKIGKLVLGLINK